ncbi:MAG: diguanylate cyclase [Acidobacteriota bacterium]|nr:diguanylate cyclase [Acidobacteriota bacterium]
MNRHTRRSSGPSSARPRELEGGAFIVDRQGTILGFDERMERLTGWPAVDVVGVHKDVACVVAPTSAGHSEPAPVPLYPGTIPVTDGGAVDLRLRCSDGHTLDVEATTRLLPGRGERVAVSLLRVLARSGGSVPDSEVDGYDALTGMIGAEVFATRLCDTFDSASRLARPLALILADVDHLRRINDRLGHRSGDRVLRTLAGILRAEVDDSDVARIGEDEFAILLENAGRGDARQTAARVRSMVERYRFFETDDVHVTLSIGAASYPADAETAADLRRRAQDALEQAREFGRNRVWCYTRRPRVPVEVPVFFDSVEPLLVGFTRDLSPSGVFVQTSSPVDIGMRCALAFPLPGQDSKVHVIGRIVRTVPPEIGPAASEIRIPGMGVEFERFGADDRHAIERFLHANESLTTRPENGIFSVD